jgi:uridine kinase
MAEKPLLIGIAGGSASGKTCLSDKVFRGLGATCCLLAVDCFYKNLTKEQLLNVGEYNFDHPDAIDFDEVLETVKLLVDRQGVSVPTYDYEICARDGMQQVGPADVIVLEGIFALHDSRLRDLMDMKIFVHTDDDERLCRRILRDTAERGRSVENVIAQYLKFVKPSYDDIIKPTMKYADLIVPKGAENKVAVDLIIHNLSTRITNSNN